MSKNVNLGKGIDLSDLVDNNKKKSSIDKINNSNHNIDVNA